MEYLKNSLDSYKGMVKRDLILSYRIFKIEKQVDIFRDLKQHLLQYEFVICQERKLSKNEYPNLLGEAKLVFKC